MGAGKKIRILFKVKKFDAHIPGPKNASKRQAVLTYQPTFNCILLNFKSLNFLNTKPKTMPIPYTVNL